jgi:phosphoribosylglycinamide formyltransferase-1
LNTAPPPQPIVILISGRGSNMHALIDRSRQRGAPYVVSHVFSDRANAPGLVTARDRKIPARALPGTKGVDRAAYDGALAAAIDEVTPSLIVLAGFMRILTPQFVRQFAGKILNIHPSLLPKYPGLDTHRRALEAGDKEHGATVHFVTAELDGGPRIIQARVAIAADDTEDSLAKRVLIQEHLIYPLAVSWFCEGRLRYQAGKALMDGRPLSEPIPYSDVEADSAP